MASTNNNERNNDNLIQWNCERIRYKKEEICEMIQIYKPAVISVEETKLCQNCDFRVPNYSLYRKDGHFSSTPHGGSAVLIRQAIPHDEIPIQTTLKQSNRSKAKPINIHGRHA